jgi:hypothetical protein
MGWERMKSREESKKRSIRGFMPFTPDANIEGTLESIHLRTTESGGTTGFFLIQLTKEATVNVRDETSKTGQDVAGIGDLVGVRKTGATKFLRDIKLGTLVSLTYLGMYDRESINPKTGKIETSPYHNIDIEVYREDLQEAA